MNADALCVIPTCADCLPWTNIANMSTSMLAYKHDRLSIPMILILKYLFWAVVMFLFLVHQLLSSCHGCMSS